jgi:uncharacterized membrane protein YfcA
VAARPLAGANYAGDRDAAAVTWSSGLLGLAAGLLIAVATTPVGVSGAVFMLPVQLSVLDVPSPAVTPTNLLFNVVAAPGALMRYRRQGTLSGPLARQLVTGTVPGVVAGAVIRVYAVPGPRVFQILLAAFLLPLGIWLVARALLQPLPRTAAPAAGQVPAPGRAQNDSALSSRTITVLALIVGVVGGIYGIGGGSILAPVLTGRGMPVTRVAPAALASTFLASVTGAATYALLALFHHGGSIAPNWPLGLACGLGGLIGGYLGARLQPRMPDRALRLLLALVAIALGALYIS